MKKWTVYLLEWTKHHGVDIERLHFGSTSKIETVWEKALLSGLYETYSTTADSLDDLFTKLNVAHPADYKHRSMSVGDVAVDEAGKAWVVRGIGWESISFPWKRYPHSGGSQERK